MKNHAISEFIQGYNKRVIEDFMRETILPILELPKDCWKKEISLCYDSLEDNSYYLETGD